MADKIMIVRKLRDGLWNVNNWYDISYSADEQQYFIYYYPNGNLINSQYSIPYTTFERALEAITDNIVQWED